MNHFALFDLLILVLVLAFKFPSGFAFEKYQEDGLELHNKLRAKHATPPLVLDEALIKIAHTCADYYVTGKEVHTCPGAEPYGENVAMSISLGPGAGANISLDVELTQAVQRWYEEKREYNFAEPKKSRGTFGHFTQLMWRETTKLGLYCVIGPGEHAWTYCVAIYDPAGNLKGSYAKNVAWRTNNVPNIVPKLKSESDPELEFEGEFEIETTTQTTLAG